jgi:hypothetical protein
MKINTEVMKDLPGDVREIVLFTIQDIQKRLDYIEELLCEEEGE